MALIPITAECSLVLSVNLHLLPHQRQPFSDFHNHLGFCLFQNSRSQHYTVCTLVANSASWQNFFQIQVAVILVVFPFYLLHNILLCKWYHQLFIHSPADKCIVFSLGLLWIKWLWTFLFRTFYWHIHLLILDYT